LFIALLLVDVACGKVEAVPDASSLPPPADAATPPPADAPAVALSCETYCTDIQTNCTGANSQYPDRDQCLATCETFTVGTSKATDTSGNTLGCRVYHTGNTTTDATLHCPHAGPGGDTITSPATYCTRNATGGGDVCDSFCSIAIAACGTTASTRTVDGMAIPAQYDSLADCLSDCAAFDNTHLFSVQPASQGDTLACRLLHATNAVKYSKLNDAAMLQFHCPHTGVTPAGPCANATKSP
jgi:hypothetical protein